ncbi:hypothetical protein [Rosistilla ulvae]|uniref:hypothetical protein n=1 Tax=Rosistilla ulvae TaxID=1930277 RepID=UPI001C54DA91|nr:hypothetical protein [Rosistilla ulvae]
MRIGNATRATEESGGGFSGFWFDRLSTADGSIHSAAVHDAAGCCLPGLGMLT